MVKMTLCLRRRPGLTPKAFRDYWQNVHGLLVAKHAAMLGIERYVQVHSLDLPGAPATSSRPEPYDGIAELWFESLEQFQATSATPEGQAARRELAEDDRRFTDVSNSPVSFGREVPIVG